MVSQTSKRRKLDSDGEMSGSDLSDHEVAPEPQSGTAATAQKPGMKRPRDDSVAAPYAGESYKSSLFKLQVDEMLEEVKPDYGKRFSSVNTALQKLKTLIEGIPDREPQPFYDAVKSIRKKSKIEVPLPEPKPDASTAYKLAYAKPAEVNVVGSYTLKTMTKTESALAVDMLVTMPASILQEKDYLNHRYFYKRAYYLSCIAAAIQADEDEAFNLRFEYLNGNDLHPILVVNSGKGKKATDFSKSKCSIRVIVGCPDSVFPKNKLQPAKNAIRPKGEVIEGATLPATPFYNASVRADCNYKAYLKLLHSTSKKAEGFVDACVLGRIWLRQRGFGGSMERGGFGHFEFAAITALLLSGGGPKGHPVLSAGYSSYQLFKGVVQFLATSNMSAKPMLFQTADAAIPKSKIPVFYDGPRCQNVLYKMSGWSYEMLREEAQVSLAMLADDTFDQFESTFILRKDHPLQQFDSLVKLDLSRRTSKIASDDHRTQDWLVCSKVFDTLKEAMTDRVKLINVELPKSSGWALKATQPESESEVTVSFVYDPEHANRAVDHGPPAEDKKASAKFQGFWGQKAELRRFKDGSILESLVWSKSPHITIPHQIVAYILNRHIGINVNTDISFIGGSFQTILPGLDDSEAAFTSLRERFRALDSTIRSFEELPLMLKQLTPIDAQLRSASVQPPIFSSRTPLQTPANVLIQFEHSGRWPDDVVAIQRTKIAFLLKISELLESSSQGYKANVGIENENSPLLNCAFLDIVDSEGASFRLRIHNDREAVLLEHQVKDKLLDAHKRELAVEALSQYRYMFTQLPLLTQSIATHCTRFPLLSPTIRLLKKWFNSHMLSLHIKEELIELLAIRTFMQPYPWRVPSSTTSGFLRTLAWIGRWDWRTQPLIVDFSGTLDVKDVSTVNTRLEAWRKIDPGMNREVVFAATNHDLTGTAFTDRGPSKVVAARMTALARGAWKVVKDTTDFEDFDVETLFVPSTQEYDFVIQLSSKFTGGQKGKKEAKSSQFKNLEVQSDEDAYLVGYEPVGSYIDELKKVYGDSVVLFWNAAGGSVIGGLWNPATGGQRAFKVNAPFATKPLKDAQHVEIDKQSIVAEMARLGGDMVKNIDVRR